jgi:hypothetical protein
VAEVTVASSSVVTARNLTMPSGDFAGYCGFESERHGFHELKLIEFVKIRDNPAGSADRFLCQ